MSNDNSKPYTADRDRVLHLDPVMRDMPREVRNVIAPVHLSGEDTFKFRCHPDISCFNQCCSNIEILLTPYDMLRLRTRLKLGAEEFLYEYATPTTLAKGQLPVAMLLMDSKTGKCPFVTEEGCSVYEDRPVTCRYYPIGLALMHRQDDKGEKEFYFMVKEEYCQGHKEDKQWSVNEWRSDQGSDGYDKPNRGWMEIILKRRSAGDATSTSVQVSEFFYMATTNPEAFRAFIFSSSFLKRYQVDEETIKRIRQDDTAVTEFAFSWLKSALFGDKDFPIRPEAVMELNIRRKQKKENAENSATSEASENSETSEASENSETSETPRIPVIPRMPKTSEMPETSENPEKA